MRTIAGLCLTAAALVLSWSVSALARKADIDVNKNNAMVTVTIPKGQVIPITVKNNNTGTTQTGNPDASGSVSFTDPDIVGNTTYDITIGADHWTVPVGNHLNEKSKEESGKASLELKDPNAPQFAFASSFSDIYGNSDGSITDEFFLQNSSQSSYLLSSAQLFTDISPTFFNQIDFDSGQAIGSGTLSQTYNNLSIGPDQFIIFDALVSPPNYDLLIVSAEQVLPDGGFGPAQQFATANSVPEPSALFLLGSGLLALGALGLTSWIGRRDCAGL